MPKLNIYGEKWKYKIGRSNVVITSPDDVEYIASQDEVTCEKDCFISKEDVRSYIEKELI